MKKVLASSVVTLDSHLQDHESSPETKERRNTFLKAELKLDVERLNNDPLATKESTVREVIEQTPT
jgi:hypothetical protein